MLWHQDNGYTFVEPQAYLTCWIALTDATPDNGCVRSLPGAHRGGTLRTATRRSASECWGDRRAARSRCRCARAASWCSRRSRRTTTERNTTDAVRKAYIVQYAPDGAVAYRPQADGSRGPAEPLDDERRQYFVVRDGQPVSA